MAVFMFGRGTPVKTDPVFSANSWEQIIKVCQKNEVPDSWKIGDYKNMTINGKEYLVAIIDKNHDVYSDGTGTAPLTLQLVDRYETRYQYGNVYTNRGGWVGSDMRNTHLPAIMSLMPSEVQSGIREVNKLTGAGGLSSTINITADKLFLLSVVEVSGSNSYTPLGEGFQYPYYTETFRRIKSGASWWLRSPCDENDTTFCEIRSEGQVSFTYPNGTNGVSFAFCF